jgi:polyisoprenoid-binding protein YceI
MKVGCSHTRGVAMRRSLLALCLTGWFASGVVLAQEPGARYVVDAARSDVHWLVYKAGALARLGHNHTIAAGDLTGSASVNERDLSASQFELELSAANLVVDDPKLRSTLGADFSSVPTDEDIAGTKKNMLSDQVLDGERYPRIRIVGAGPVGSAGMQVLNVKVELLGRTVDLTVPTVVTVENAELRAKGEFEINHADLGMKPFSVMMGALQVGEKLSFSYDVVARRETR